MNAPENKPATEQPWWRFGHVWMLIAGPVVVVVAGFFTYYLAVRIPDPVLPTTAQTTEGSAQASDISQAPAVQARNHAATGVLPAPPSTKP